MGCIIYDTCGLVVSNILKGVTLYIRKMFVVYVCIPHICVNTHRVDIHKTNVEIFHEIFGCAT